MTGSSRFERGLAATVVVIGVGAAQGDIGAVRPAKAEARQSLALVLSGAPLRHVVICGAQHAVYVAGEHARVAATITLPDARSRRSAGSNAHLVVERCADGRWQKAGSRRLGTPGADERVRRRSTRVEISAAGDYRIRARVAGDRQRRPVRSGPVYLRVGVGEIADVPVSFAVRNVNRSRAPCLPDDRGYTVRGHLVAPRAALTAPAPRAVTLYLHGSALGEPIWRLPRYDYPYEMAKLGHASVTIDRLGFGASDIPHGRNVCLGADADVSHQIVGALRKAAYSTERGTPTDFQKVAIAGHSYGGVVAPVEAYSFQDVDALLGLGSAFDQGFAPSASDVYLDLFDGAAVCSRGGEPKRAGGPIGYFLFLKRLLPKIFFNADPAIVQTVRHLHEREPCGEVSLAPALLANRLYLRTVTVPVLLVFADHDVGFPASSHAEPQRDLYRGSPDVTAAVIENTGHMMMLERTAPAFRATVSQWLRRRGF